MAPHSSTLAWKIHGRRSLVGCSPWGREELDMTERLHFHFHMNLIIRIRHHITGPCVIIIVSLNDHYEGMQQNNEN